MGNCLKTQLKEVVNNNNLFKVGEIPVVFEQVATPSVDTNAISIKVVYDAIECRVTNGYFTDSTFQQNLGTTKTIAAWSTETLYISNTGATLFIPNKYGNIGSIEYVGSGWERENIKIKLSNICYMNKISSLECRGMDVTEDIENLATCSELDVINLTNCYNVGGSIDKLLNNAIVPSIDLTSNGKFTFDLSKLGEGKLRNIYLYNSNKISGPLSKLKCKDVSGSYPLKCVLDSRDGAGVTGLVSDLSNFFIKFDTSNDPSNISIGLYACYNVAGSVNDFCDYAYNQGKVAGKINFEFDSTKATGVTVNGSIITKNNYTASFNASGYTIE